MSKPRIEAVIDTDGKVVISVDGCPGPGCEALTADVERALGRVTEDRKTAEHAQRPPTQRVRQ